MIVTASPLALGHSMKVRSQPGWTSCQIEPRTETWFRSVWSLSPNSRVTLPLLVQIG